MNSALLETIKTKEDAITLASQLQAIQKGLFSIKTDIKKLLEKILPYKQQEILLETMREAKVFQNDNQSLQKFLKDLQQQVEKLPVLSLTIAFEPKETTIDMIRKWFDINYKQSILLDITVDPTIVGGAIVLDKGMYKDYSLKKRLQDKPEISNNQVKIQNAKIKSTS